MIFIIHKSIVHTYTYLYIHVVLFKNDFRQFGKPCPEFCLVFKNIAYLEYSGFVSPVVKVLYLYDRHLWG